MIESTVAPGISLGCIVLVDSDADGWVSLTCASVAASLAAPAVSLPLRATTSALSDGGGPTDGIVVLAEGTAGTVLLSVLLLLFSFWFNEVDSWLRKVPRVDCFMGFEDTERASEVG